MGIFDKFDNCYQYNIKIGLISDGKKCQGEFNRSDKVYKRCLKRPYLDTQIYLDRWSNDRI